MSDNERTLGKIQVSANAIAAIASHAVLRSYGVVGMASKNTASAFSIVDSLANALTRDPRKGVEVHVHERTIDIDLYVIVEYGTRISAVANSLANAVRFNVEKALGMPVGEVNVHVQGLRVSSTD